jgi:environmental stress-induced protein Ves
LNHRNPALSGANVVWQSGTGATSNQLFFYNGNATRDRFNFRVSDGLLSSNGAFDIAIR